MSKQRIIKDEVWDDEWFYDLDPVEKLVWLFLLTNTRCNIAGFYKLNPKWGARTVGLDLDIFQKIMLRFVRDEKLFMHEEWLVILNFTKHQAENPSVKIGIKRVLESVPDEIIDSLRQAVPGCPTLLYFTLLNADALRDQSPTPPPEEEAPVAPPKVKAVKSRYGELKNVLLTDDEKAKLKEIYGATAAKDYVERVSLYLGSHGKRYKSHYAVIRSWMKRDRVEILVKRETPVLPAPIEDTADPEMQKKIAEIRGSITSRLRKRNGEKET